MTIVVIAIFLVMAIQVVIATQDAIKIHVTVIAQTMD
jgi:hypothetical protein